MPAGNDRTRPDTGRAGTGGQPVTVTTVTGKAGLTALHKHQEQRLLTGLAISLIGPGTDMGVTVTRNRARTRVSVEHWTGAKRTVATLTVLNTELDTDPTDRAFILTTTVVNLTEAIKATVRCRH